MLSNIKCRFALVKNGQEAVDFFKANHQQPSGDKVDMILMDCMMPVKDGFEATKEIREYEKEKSLVHTVILALTASASKADEAKCYDCGMDGVLLKPIDRQTLYNFITKEHTAE